MHVSAVMSRSIFTAYPNSTVKELWRLLFAKHVNAIPVVDKKRLLLGIVTKEDILRTLYPDYQEYFQDVTSIQDFEEMEEKVAGIGTKKASDIMCKKVIFTRVDTPIMRVLSRMIVRSLNQLPVLSENNEVIGMVTKGDIFYALFKKRLQKAKKSKK